MHATHSSSTRNTSLHKDNKTTIQQDAVTTDWKQCPQPYRSKQGLSDSNICQCGQIENTEHLLLRCQLQGGTTEHFSKEPGTEAWLVPSIHAGTSWIKWQWKHTWIQGNHQKNSSGIHPGHRTINSCPSIYLAHPQSKTPIIPPFWKVH